MLICKKPVLIALFLSLALGVMNFLAVRRFSPPEPSVRGYAALVLDEGAPEQAAVEALNAAGMGPVIAETTQWVFLDDFGALIRLPLDSFFRRIEEFDPRNDGYALRLRSFFVHGGKRRIYLPLAADLNRRISAVLQDTPFSLETAGSTFPSVPVLWRFLLFIPAAAGSFFLAGPSLAAAALIPPLAALAFFGASGFALAAALFGFFTVLRPPLEEILSFRRPGTVRQCGGSFLFSWVLAVLFAGLAGGILHWGKIPLLPALAGILSTGGAFAAALLAEFSLEKARGHIRFMPVPIRPPLGFSLLPRSTLPFALASLAALWLPALFREDAGPRAELPALITAGEYEAHAAFQAAFSLRSLADESGSAGGQAEAPYLRYALGEDGLITGGRAYTAPENQVGVEPFPLEDLMAFLGEYQGDPPPDDDEEEPFLAMMMGIFCIPVLIPHRRYGKMGIAFPYNDKRVAA